MNLIGQKFGRLTVIKKAGINIAKSGFKTPLWLCECECGNKKIIRQPKLIGNYTKSCGCLRKEKSRIHAKNLNLVTDYKQYIKDNVVKNNGCWEWTGSYFENGRPRTGIKNCGQTKVSRLSYQEFVCKFNQDLFVCHTCDNPKCVNPNHLFLGTAQDNADDMVNKCRSLKGEKHHKTKLKTANVVYIRNSKRKKKFLAKKFSVSISTINDIKQRRSWTHI